MFRFDFSHFSKVTQEELIAVENFVNARIDEQLPLQESRNIPYQRALGEGAIALFGEKYGDVVRTIRFGQSIELCGGTHVANTSEIWRFKIISESAVAAGIRRVEAITGDAVIKFFEEQSQTLQQLNHLLKVPQDITKSVQQLQEENIYLKKELNNLQRLKSQVVFKEILVEIKEVKGIFFFSKKSRHGRLSSSRYVL
jgi:alanyl-tRNA synthetase